MESEVFRLTEEMKNRMLGYVVLLQYRYSNLCIKADAMSLMPIEIECGGTELRLEEAADVALKDEFTFVLVPKSNDLIPSIVAGTKKAHPEFGVEVARMEQSDDDEDKVVYFRMPEVDDDRKKDLEDAVKTLGDECRAKIDATRDMFRARIAMHMGGEDKETVDSRNKEIDGIYDWHVDKYDELVRTKNKEISDAWEQWRQRQAAESTAGSEASDARGDDVVSKLKLG